MCLLILASCGPRVDSRENTSLVSSRNNLSEAPDSNSIGYDNSAAIDPIEQNLVRESKERERRDWAEGEKFRQWQNRVRPTPRNAFPAMGKCYYGHIIKINKYHVFYSNGLQQLPDPGYDSKEDKEIARSRVGDKVKMCVVSLPTDCPPGDFRGITYRAHNLRTGGEWEEGDSLHVCGGP